MSNKKYVPKIANVKFKPDVNASDLENVVSEYKLTKTFPEKEFSSDLELSRLYVLDISKGNGNKLVKELRKKYQSLLEYVSIPPARKLMWLRWNKNEKRNTWRKNNFYFEE